MYVLVSACIEEILVLLVGYPFTRCREDILTFCSTDQLSRRVFCLFYSQRLIFKLL